MRISIRYQVQLPIVTIQTVAIAAITIASVSLSTNRAERQIVDRVEGVIESVAGSSFPLTEGVLTRMHGLSGAEFIVYDSPGSPVAASDPILLNLAPSLSNIRIVHENRFGSLSAAPKVSVNGESHLAVLISARSPAPGAELLVLYPESSWREARREAAQAPLILGAGAIALMWAATSWIAHRISGRIHRLEHQVARIAEGDFRDIALGAQQDEVQDLERSINVMCVQLRQMRETIAQTERTHLLAQLAAGLAHQLRNALTGARLSLQLHQRRCNVAPGDPSIDVAFRQLALTEEQVQGLLTLGQSDRRPHVRTDLVPLLQDLTSLLQPTAEHNSVALELRLGQRSATVDSDEAGLRAAILNLVLNAIEAAGVGGSVSIELLEKKQQVSITVSDSGPGPPARLSETMFEPFVTGKPEGVGLGLALARQVALAHDGSLSWAREGIWTRFHLNLPRTAPDDEEELTHEPGSGC
jgi:signal transduction histidine kinase